MKYLPYSTKSGLSSVICSVFIFLVFYFPFSSHLVLHLTHLAYTSAGGIDLMSPEMFFYLYTKRKGLLQHTVSALARLTFYHKNLFIGRETSVRRPH